MGLRRFTPKEVVISREDAWKILKFFFGDLRVLPRQITEQDRAFAQALLLEAADRSYEMGYTEIIYDTFFMSHPRSLDAVRDLLEEFIKKSAKHWWEHASQENLKEPKLYIMVVNTIKRNFRSVWRIREDTGSLTY